INQEPEVRAVSNGKSGPTTQSDPNDWTITGNANATSPGTNFIGTTNDYAVEIHVDDGGSATQGRKRVMRYEPNNTSANIIGGHNTNTIASGQYGSIIAGGGDNTDNNQIGGNYGAIVGGSGNNIQG